MSSSEATGGMRRVVVTAPGTVQVVGVPRPDLRPGEARVRMTVTGVCGSDVHACHGTHPFVPLPYQPGHEVVGVVTELDDETGADAGVRVGDRVTVEPTLPCLTCKMCRTGRSNICENLRFFGCGYEQGGMADEFTVPASRLHVIPDDVDDLDAALIEPLATPVHAVRLAGDVSGRAVVVLGAGTIGLLVLKALRHAGAGRIVMTDVLAAKRELALELGADAVVDAARPDVADAMRAALGESADVVLDCVAVQSTLDLGVELIGRGGTLVVVGVAARPVTVPLPVIQDRQIRIQGSATYLPDDYDRSLEIIRSGEVTAADFITARFPMSDAADAFAAAADGDDIKVIVTPH